MEINTQTKLIARLHTDENGTGLDIYNPYFQDVGLNVVYMLFRDNSPQPLIEGMRKLNISGAITAGFEHDSSLPSLVDEVSEAVEVSGRIGIIANQNGKLLAHYQGGEGLLSAIQEKYDISGKRVVIVGAGTVARTLLLAIDRGEHKPSQVIVVNRSTDNARVLSERFACVDSAQSLDDLNHVDGDIFVNATRIGSSVEDIYFTGDIVNKYKAVADVTFGDPNTNLVSLADASNLIVINGWDMFTHQASVVLRVLLNHDADISILRNFVTKGLAKTNHGTATGVK
jgi:shikimate 5-dehydrogenase